MHFSIDIEDYTASDTSSSNSNSNSTISSLNSSPVSIRRINNNQNYIGHSYSTNSYDNSPNSSESSASTYFFMPNATIVNERPYVNADNVLPIVNTEHFNNNEFYESESNTSEDLEDLFFNSKIKWRKMTLFTIFIIILFYMINSFINNSGKNGYDNFFILTFRTLSDYPECKPIQYEIWRLFTNSLLHADIGHLISNIFFIYFTGYFLESIVGHYYFLLYFYIGCFGGSLAVAYLNRYSISIGASHAAMSLSGALLGTVIFNKDVLNFTFNLLTFISLIPLIIDIISYSFLYNKNISYIGHWIGYLNGFLLSSFLSKNIIPKNWKLIFKTSFFNIFLLLNIFLLFDYFHYDYKKNVMNEQFKKIEFNTCCHRYIEYNFNHNFTCIT